MTSVPTYAHPLSALSIDETSSAAEPAKKDLIKFLNLEHASQLTPETPRPPRQATVHHVVVEGNNATKSIEAVVDLAKREQVWEKVVDTNVHPSFTLHELEETVKICKSSSLLQSQIDALSLPEGFEAVVEPWPYGGLDVSVATGGENDSFLPQARSKGVIDHCRPTEYVPELLDTKMRDDLKELNVIQPNGASFSVTDDSLVEWQKWRMRVSFNPREGAVVHDVLYDGRSILYRLSISDMTVPYADPRNPFHRKQAFDFGDGGIGHCANNLELGCDCLGVIKYFDGVLNRPDGTAHASRNVICLHEQDNGIGWKHTNWRTNRAVVTRRRELVIQFILTVANYEYVFNYKFDQAGGIAVETRATGILSAVNIDPGKKAPWGNIVSPGVQDQNHQHIFCVRIDPAIDGHENTLVQQESLPLQIDERTNPNGNAYNMQETPITTSIGLDAAPRNARLFKIQNLNKKNPVSGQPVGYKIVPPPTQLLLADRTSRQAQRALFAQHHVWVTKYKDDELYAGGRYTLQSTVETEGVADAAARCDDVLQEDIVVWSVFGLTHNPRVEDWPVMPVETIQLHMTPVDFFSANPALDVPSNRNLTSEYAGIDGEATVEGGDRRAACCE
ncbi:Copper amine oxidase 1 [Colletotrichum sidae]|uniref:Amine oxidase n=1 Tax=Colletotrichum sidae TaxID=1347389 RepID=A0A4R8TLM6_9PEZI|nr:Copper amine oxidase 1 [Colletotrichum sidae]